MAAKEHYVSNKDLYAAMVVYHAKVKHARENNLPKPRVPEYIGSCIMKIATRLATKPNFRKYSYAEDMTQDGALACIRYIDNFNPDKYQNPFAYFTQIIMHAFVGRLNTEQKQQYVKAKLMKDVTAVAGELGIDNMDSEVTDSDPTNNVIEAFERRMADRKAKAAKNKQEQADA